MDLIAGADNTTGSTNSFFGNSSGGQNTIGNNNVAMGRGALLSNQTGNNNVAIGTNAAFGSTGQSISGGVFIGYEAGQLESNDNRLYIANSDTNNPLIYGEFDTNLLRVNGTLDVTQDVSANSFISSTTTYPDYVFENYLKTPTSSNGAYQFKTLDEVRDFIKKYKHLPGVKGIYELEKNDKGYVVNMSELSIQTLEKVEELFIHTLEQQDTIDRLNTESKALKTENETLKKRLKVIEDKLGIKL